MGVPKFAGWIFNNRTRKLTVPYIPQNVASLSFDVNSIIHGCAQIVYNYGEWQSEQRNIVLSELTDHQLEQELFKLIGDTFLRIVERVQPKLFLVLAVDGVAPLAKVQQQRCRRYRAVVPNSSSSPSTPMRFDPNCITPGTDFMFRLDAYLKKWIETNHHLLPEKVLYSNHMVSGEGEQKIFDYVRNYELSGYGSHIIYGLDADLIILSLISRLNGVYLLREKNLDQNKFERLIRIDELRNYIQDRMQTTTAIDDFAVLTFFLGNDFVPTSPMFVGDMYDTIEYLLDVYYKLGVPLTFPKEGKINIKNFLKFLKVLSGGELECLKNVYRHPPRLGFKTLELSTQSFIRNGEMVVKINKDEFYKNWYTKIFAPPIHQSEMAFELPNALYLEIFEPSPKKIETLVKEYITSFLWTYLYYKKGTSAVDTHFFYANGYAPLMSDVVKYFPLSDISVSYVDHEPKFTTLHQLLAVLPPKSIHSLPSELHSFYQPDSLIYDMFPVKVEIDTEAKDIERLGVVRMNPVEPKRLLTLNLGMSEERMKRYKSENSLCFHRKIISEDAEPPIRNVAPLKEEPEKKEENEFPKNAFLRDFERLRKMKRDK
jgi:5'-3' exonuclease